MAIEDIVEQPEGTVAPSFSATVNKKKTHVFINTTLHKVPHQCMIINAERDTFTIDCRKFSKKYFLKISYPSGVSVNGDACEARLEFGILKCKIPVVEDAPRKKGKSTGKDGGQPSKAGRNESPKKDSTSPSAKKVGSKAVKKTEETKAKNNDAKVHSMPPNKRGKKRGAENSEMGAQEPEEETQKKRRKLELQKRKAPVEDSKALSLVDEINDSQEEKEFAKLRHMKAKEVWMEGEEEKKSTKAAARQAKKNELKEKAVQKIKNRENAKQSARGKNATAASPSDDKKGTKKRVSFSNKEDVKEIPALKKKKRGAILL